MARNDPNHLPLVVALTGASGICYGIRLIEALLEFHLPPHLILSSGAELVAQTEAGVDLNPLKEQVAQVHPVDDLAASVASGSFPVGGMVISPCSMKTLSMVAHGIELNLVARAAMCQLKEGRKLVLVPRETPLALPTLENLHKAALAGAIILPAMPGFYHKPLSQLTVQDLVDFVVGKTLDQFSIPHTLFKRWGSLSTQ